MIRRHLPTIKTIEGWKKEHLRDSNNYRCDMCKINSSVETIEHIYLECPKVVAFLIEVRNFFNKSISIFPGPEWKNDHYMFGTMNKEHSIFYMVLRSFIWYDCKKKHKEPKLMDFIGKLIDRTDKLCKVSTWNINDRPIKKKTVQEYKRIMEELKKYITNDCEKLTFRISY